ncbi:MAG: hypothetical protein KL840_20985 [Aquamicrobium sp.]|nr:hypothetical protein [Aquamicrobium sp.]
MHAGTFIRTTLLLAAIGVAVTACGRRPGTLDTPYEAARDAREEARRNDQPLPPAPKPPVQDRKFFLDGLI